MIAHNKTLAAQLCNEFREFFPKTRSSTSSRTTTTTSRRPTSRRPTSTSRRTARGTTRSTGSATRHVEAALAARRDHRRVRLLHLRPRLARGVRGALVFLDGRRGAGPRRPPAQARRYPVRAQRRGARPRAVPGQGGRARDPAGAHARPRTGSRSSATRSSRSRTSTRSRARCSRGSTRSRSSRRRSTSRRSRRSSAPTVEISAELEAQVKSFEEDGKMLEAHRIRQRTEYDLEMMRELGFCNGIENYSRILDGRPPGSAPHTLLDYFPSDFLIVRRRVARDDSADRRHVRGRPVAQADARRLRLPAPVGARQPAAALRRVPREGAAVGPRLGDAGPWELQRVDEHRRAADPPDRDRRPRDRAAPDQDQIDDLLERDPSARGGRASGRWSRP